MAIIWGNFLGIPSQLLPGRNPFPISKITCSSLLAETLKIQTLNPQHLQKSGKHDFAHVGSAPLLPLSFLFSISFFQLKSEFLFHFPGMRGSKRRHLTAPECQALAQSPEGLSPLRQPLSLARGRGGRRQSLHPTQSHPRGDLGILSLLSHPSLLEFGVWLCSSCSSL